MSASQWFDAGRKLAEVDDSPRVKRRKAREARGWLRNVGRFNAGWEATRTASRGCRSSGWRGEAASWRHERVFGTCAEARCGGGLTTRNCVVMLDGRRGV